MTTDALRTRLERGLRTRLRDVADGRPKREHLGPALREVMAAERVVVASGEQRELERHFEDRLFGLGPLAPLLRDDRVSEVMVNGSRGVWIERDGRLEQTGVRLSDDEILVIIERLVAPLGRRIDLATPLVDARLPDGSRVHAVIPPISLAGPILTIRRFTERALGPDDLVRLGACERPVMDALLACVRERRSILVSGGTSSGKTTTLNALAFAIGDRERIVTIEDAAELQLRQEHVVTLESRPPNIEGKGAIPIRELVRNSLRMRPDRIIVGECRSGEALDMLQAMNTGHDGSMSTGHANSPRDMLARLETMVLMAGVDLPVRAIREQVASAVDLIVQQSRLKDGTRRIVNITEVQGMEGDVIVMQDVFVFEQTGVVEGKIQGRLKPTGIRPKFVEKFEVMGINLPPGLFGFTY